MLIVHGDLLDRKDSWSPSFLNFWSYFEALFGDHDDQGERVTFGEAHWMTLFITPVTTRCRVQDQLSVSDTWIDMQDDIASTISQIHFESSPVHGERRTQSIRNSPITGRSTIDMYLGTVGNRWWNLCFIRHALHNRCVQRWLVIAKRWLTKCWLLVCWKRIQQSMRFNDPKLFFFSCSTYLTHGSWGESPRNLVLSRSGRRRGRMKVARIYGRIYTLFLQCWETRETRERERERERE